MWDSYCVAVCGAGHFSPWPCWAVRPLPRLPRQAGAGQEGGRTYLQSATCRAARWDLCVLSAVWIRARAAWKAGSRLSRLLPPGTPVNWLLLLGTCMCQLLLPGRHRSQLILPGTHMSQLLLPGTHMSQLILPGTCMCQLLLPGTHRSQLILPGTRMSGLWLWSSCTTVWLACSLLFLRLGGGGPVVVQLG